MSGGSQRYGPNMTESGKAPIVKSAHMYRKYYDRALNAPEEFWAEQAQCYLSWEKQWETVVRSDFEEGMVEWFSGGLLNASFNCLDRHLDRLKDKPAYLWEGVARDESVTVTYGELSERVNKLASALKARGIGRGDRVVIYMPMVPELPVTMLACARIGAVHCVVYSGFGMEALTYRIQDCTAKAVLTAECGFTPGKIQPLEAKVNAAIKECPHVETVIVLKRTQESVTLGDPREIWWHDALGDPALPSSIPPEPMDAESPLFILYTSGATGKAKGVVHTHGGYLLHAAMTTQLIFDLKDEDTLWVTDDIGWICGHSYVVYGPLTNSATSVIAEGEISRPQADRMWSFVQKHGVSKFFTFPSTIRRIAAHDPDSVDRHDLSSLQMVGLIEQAVDTDTWEWTYDRIAKRNSPIVHAYGQTEAGGILIAPFPDVFAEKPGYCSLPFFGVKPVILDPETGKEVQYPDQEGVLCIERPWPGMARTIYGDHDRFIEGAFARVPGLFFTGDGASRNDEGDYRILGRVDDVINSDGRRLGIPELESVLVRHEAVEEAAVVGFPHPIKGIGAYAFIHVHSEALQSDGLKDQIKGLVLDVIGDFAVIDLIQWVQTLPRTPSGKILRVILQKIAAGALDTLGDYVTIADPAVVESLVKGRLEPKGL